MAQLFSPTLVSLDKARNLPLWRQPVALLVVMSVAMPMSFAVWNALLNNFVVNVAGLDGVGIGWLQSVREIPGFLAVGVIAVIMFMREQILGVVALIALGAAVAVTAFFPTFSGLLVTTMISSLGFHYYETVNQSLQLQWIDRHRAPQVIGWLVAAGSGASLAAYGLIVIGWKYWGLTYVWAYLLGGGATVLLAIICLAVYPQFESRTPQARRMVLRRRYWLYYALQFVAGARRQIFVVFAAFMMVEKFGFDVHALTALFLINYVANIVLGPLVGRLVTLFGERRAMVLEYSGLVLVFLSYGGLYVFDWSWRVAGALYVIDHLLFALAFAQKTYFQKIAAPEDIAPTAAVAFTINHIAAVFLPAALGYLWVRSPESVFVLAALMAVVSLVLVAMIPRHPRAGHETVFASGWRPFGAGWRP